MIILVLDPFSSCTADSLAASGEASRSPGIRQPHLPHQRVLTPEGNECVGTTSHFSSPKPDLSIAVSLVFLGSDRATETPDALPHRVFLLLPQFPMVSNERRCGASRAIADIGDSGAAARRLATRGSGERSNLARSIPRPHPCRQGRGFPESSNILVSDRRDQHRAPGELPESRNLGEIDRCIGGGLRKGGPCLSETFAPSQEQPTDGGRFRIALEIVLRSIVHTPAPVAKLRMSAPFERQVIRCSRRGRRERFGRVHDDVRVRRECVNRRRKLQDRRRVRPNGDTRRKGSLRGC